MISFGILLDLQDNIYSKNPSRFCHNKIKNKNTSDFLSGAVWCIPHLPVGSISLTNICTGILCCTVAFQMHIIKSGFIFVK